MKNIMLLLALQSVKTGVLRGAGRGRFESPFRPHFFAAISCNIAPWLRRKPPLEDDEAVELHRLKDKGLIDYQRFSYYVNVPQLVQATGSDNATLTTANGTFNAGIITLDSTISCATAGCDSAVPLIFAAIVVEFTTVVGTAVPLTISAAFD